MGARLAPRRFWTALESRFVNKPDGFDIDLQPGIFVESWWPGYELTSKKEKKADSGSKVFRSAFSKVGGSMMAKLCTWAELNSVFL